MRAGRESMLSRAVLPEGESAGESESTDMDLRCSIVEPSSQRRRWNGASFGGVESLEDMLGVRDDHGSSSCGVDGFSAANLE